MKLPLLLIAFSASALSILASQDVTGEPQGRPDTSHAEAAVNALVEALLDDSNSYMKNTLKSALSGLGPAAKDGVPALIGLLEHPDYQYRLVALTALGRMPSEAKQIVPAITRLLETDRDWNLRPMVVKTLGDFGPAAEAALPSLRRLAESDKDSDADYSSAIKRIDVQPHIKRSGDEDPRVRSQAAGVLESMGPSAIEPGSGSVSPQQAEDLKLQPPGKGAALPLAKSLLEAEDPKTRAEAARALERMQAAALPALPALTKALEDESDHVRHFVVQALDKIGPAGVPALITAIEDEKKNIRWNAIYALVDHGAAQAMPALIRALEDEDPRVRAHVLMVIETARHAAGDAVPVLNKLQEAEQDPGKIRKLAIAATEITVASKEWESALGGAQSSDPKVRVEAVKTIHRLGRNGWLHTKAAENALINALEDEDADVREAAAAALGEGRKPVTRSTVPALSKAIEDADVRVRVAAAAALARHGSDAPALLVALEDEDPSVRAAAINSIVPFRPAALPAFLKAMKDEDPEVAYKALDKMRLFISAHQDYFTQKADAAIMSALIEAMNSEDKRKCRTALAAISLKYRTPTTLKAVPEIINALHDKDREIRQRAAKLLGDFYAASPPQWRN